MSHALCLLLARDVLIATIAIKKTGTRVTKQAAQQAAKKAAEQEAKQAAEKAAVPVLLQKRSSVRLHLTLACTRKPIRCATNTGIASSKHTRIGAKV
jgi:hypothetical protein